MSAPVLIVSSDCHIGLELSAYKDYLESQYHSRLDDYSARVSAATQRQATEKATVRKYRRVDEIEQRRAFSDQVSSDNDRRIKELEADHVVGEVLFPNGMSIPFAGGFGNADAIEGEAAELAMAGQRAHNRWLAEFVDPSRQVGVAMLSYADIDAAVREVGWAADAGLRSVGLNGIQTNVPPPWDSIYEPLWDALEETGLPISFHAGVGTPPPSNAHVGSAGIAQLAEWGPLPWAVNLTEGNYAAHRPLWFFIWGGVLERHPGLKLAFTEQSSGWIEHALAFMDWQWEYGSHSEDTLIPQRPSEYWARQCFTGASIMTLHEVAHRREIGVAQMMFGTDFPHPEGTYGKTVSYLNHVLAGSDVTEAEARAMLGENAVRCYGLDLTALQTIAARVGPTIEEILIPVDPPVDDPETIMWAAKPPFLF
jgi:predicted TIM-barrel fold metal-dependent hydrolase